MDAKVKNFVATFLTAAINGVCKGAASRFRIYLEPDQKRRMNDLIEQIVREFLSNVN